MKQTKKRFIDWQEASHGLTKQSSQSNQYAVRLSSSKHKTEENSPGAKDTWRLLPENSGHTDNDDNSNVGNGDASSVPCGCRKYVIANVHRVLNIYSFSYESMPELRRREEVSKTLRFSLFSQYGHIAWYSTALSVTGNGEEFSEFAHQETFVELFFHLHANPADDGVVERPVVGGQGLLQHVFVVLLALDQLSETHIAVCAVLTISHTTLSQTTRIYAHAYGYKRI